MVRFVRNIHNFTLNPMSYLQLRRQPGINAAPNGRQRLLEFVERQQRIRHRHRNLLQGAVVVCVWFVCEGESECVCVVISLIGWLNKWVNGWVGGSVKGVGVRYK